MFVEHKYRFVRRALALAVLAPLALVPVHAENVIDIGVATGFQDTFGGVLKKGRALIAADWDNDGRMDFYLGNPGNTSFFIKNELNLSNGHPKMTFIQWMPEITYAWGAAAADYDNDGDIDLFVAAGGNECAERDYLYQNQWIESGETEVSFIEVAEAAGVRGPVLPGYSEPVDVPTGNAVWVDYNRDGWVDLFANGNSRVSCTNNLDPLVARNTLWKNNQDGTFTDVTAEVGLDLTLFDTRHSTFLDIENDGDWDLYEMNLDAPNVLWRNRLTEDGVVTFEDVTAAFSPGEEDVSFPIISFVSCSEDLDNDGFHDIVSFARGPHSRSNWDGFQAPAPGIRARRSGPDCSLAPRRGQLDHLSPHALNESPANIVDNPYGDGHAIFMNQGGLAFINEAVASGINNPFEEKDGVMGSQLGDMNADGWIDIYIGNGGPRSGQFDQLFISDPNAAIHPSWINRSDLIDFAARKAPGGPASYPSYPYRTHGTILVDIDLDGDLELGVSNGGPADSNDDVREPNRMFKFFWDDPVVYLKVRPRGNGIDSSRDGIGTRVAVTVSEGGENQRTIHRTLWGGSCFSAQSGHELYFGLGAADQIDEVKVLWTNGDEEVFNDVEINTLLEVDQL